MGSRARRRDCRGRARRRARRFTFLVSRETGNLAARSRSRHRREHGTTSKPRRDVCRLPARRGPWARRSLLSLLSPRVPWRADEGRRVRVLRRAAARVSRRAHDGHRNGAALRRAHRHALRQLLCGARPTHRDARRLARGAFRGRTRRAFGVSYSAGSGFFTRTTRATGVPSSGSSRGIGGTRAPH